MVAAKADYRGCRDSGVKDKGRTAHPMVKHMKSTHGNIRLKESINKTFMLDIV